MLDTRYIVESFFGDIGVPDEHKLEEPDIDPEGAKGKEIAAKVMEVILVYGFEVLEFFEDNGGDSDGSECLDEGSGESIDTEHGTKPVGIERHNPIEVSESDG